MSESMNITVVSKPEPKGEDLSALAGRWNGSVQVKITKPMPVRPSASSTFGRKPGRRTPAPGGHADPADRVGKGE